MRSFIIKSLIFFLLAGVLAALASAHDHVPTVRPSMNVARVQVAPEYRDLDILFSGSSYTYNGVNTAMLDSAGYNVYNLGVSSSGPGFCDLLISDYLNATDTPPRVVFLEVSRMMFTILSDNWKRISIHRFLNQPIANEQITLRFATVSQYPMMVGNSFRRSMSSLSPRKQTALFDSYLAHMKETRGFEENHKAFASDAHFFARLQGTAFQNRKRERMIALVDRLQAAGITVVMHEMPTFRLREFLTDEFDAEYARTLDMLSERCTVIRLEGDEFNRQEYFATIDHMNHIGARKYTLHLISQIRALESQGTL